MKRFILAGILIVSCAALASAQLPTLNFGGGGQGGTPLAACGNGTINLSTGCTTNIILGLGP